MRIVRRFEKVRTFETRYPSVIVAPRWTRHQLAAFEKIWARRDPTVWWPGEVTVVKTDAASRRAL